MAARFTWVGRGCWVKVLCCTGDTFSLLLRRRALAQAVVQLDYNTAFFFFCFVLCPWCRRSQSQSFFFELADAP